MVCVTIISQALKFCNSFRELSLCQNCLSLTFRVLRVCQVYQVSPVQKELEFLVRRFVFRHLFTSHLHTACFSVHSYSVVYF